MKNVILNLDWSVLTNTLLSIIPALICITVHESCHGLAALWLGDDTVKTQGRISLNPLRHLDISGLIMICLFHFGWAKPVPVDMRKFRNRRAGMALTALAGPASNILLAALFFLLYGFLYMPLEATTVGMYALEIFYLTAVISTNLAIFNLIPIPSLDGSKVLFALLPDAAYQKLMQYERYGMILLIVLLVSNLLDAPLSTASGWAVGQFWLLVQGGLNLWQRLFW